MPETEVTVSASREEVSPSIEGTTLRSLDTLGKLQHAIAQELADQPSDWDSQLPPSRSRSTQCPSTQSPSTQSPSTQSPSTQSPSTQSPSTQFPTSSSRATVEGDPDEVKFHLSVIIPVYNEEKTIERIIRTVCQLPLSLEVIAVDDGSQDGTFPLLQSLSAELPMLRLVRQPQNFGKGKALRTGFEAARGTHVIIQDADLEYDPTDIPALVEPILQGDADVVYGSRFLEQTWCGSSWIHRLGNRMLTYWSNLFTGCSLTDMETGYKLFPRDLLQRFELEQDGFGFEVELTAKLAQQGVRIVERPISYHARNWREGKKIGWRDAIEAIRCVVRYRSE